MNLKFSVKLRGSAGVLILTTTLCLVNVAHTSSSLASSTTTASSIHESKTSKPPERATKFPLTTSSVANNDAISFGIRSFTVKVSANEQNIPATTRRPPLINPTYNRILINQRMAADKIERSDFDFQRQNDASKSKLLQSLGAYEKLKISPAASSRQKIELDNFFPSKDEDFRPMLMESSRKLNRTKMSESQIQARPAADIPIRYNKMDQLSTSTPAVTDKKVESEKINDSSTLKNPSVFTNATDTSNSSCELIKSPTSKQMTVTEERVDDGIAEKAETTFKSRENIDIRIIPPEKHIDLRSVTPNLVERSTANLDCNISNLPSDATFWHGNATHVLNFPLKKFGETLSWEASSDIQSGDVLLVEIVDHYLVSSNERKRSKKTTLDEDNRYMNSVQVYQVTRLGHENCDVTEGELLDISALKVDDKKLVTLYDKDLTDGLNLLIIVSKLWGEQCVKLKVNMKSDNCGENAECSGKGVCYSDPQMDVYECHCCDGYAKYHCEEIDLCSPSACRNGGICLDMAQGHEGSSYQCLCPYGYSGRFCEIELDPCRDQCMNGATCVRNSSYIKSTNQTLQFRCECPQGFAGPLCQHNLNECEASPCVHGICVKQEDGFRCFCQPGFSGDRCELEYNECFSSPCINGICSDQIGGYSCHCNAGWTGERCHIKIDFCASNPCEDGFRCIDHGDKFSCVCPGEQNGEHNSPDCLDLPRTLCTENKCRNGATCWSTSSNPAHIGSFYCACPLGFDGKLCEDKYVVDTFVDSNELLLDNNVISFERFEDTLDSQSSWQTTYLVAIATVLSLATVGAMIVAAYFYCNINNNYQKLLRRQCDLMSALKMKKKRVRESFGRSHWLMSERNYSNVVENQQDFIKYNQPTNFQDSSEY